MSTVPNVLSNSLIYPWDLFRREFPAMQDQVVNVIYAYSLPKVSDLFSQYYDARFSPSIDSLDDATTFLLAEHHDPESTWRQLNGQVINYLYLLYPLNIFSEELPFGRQDKYAKEIKRLYQIRHRATNTNFSGWDAADSEPNVKEMRTALGDLEKLKAQQEDLCRHIRSIEQRNDPSESALAEELRNKKNEIADKITNAGLNIDELVKKTFPIRTQSMAYVLKLTNTISPESETRSIFIAGSYHLEEQTYLGPEFYLDPLFKALDQHRAAVILIPKIVDPTQSV